jgi:uncharacterized integral membrane protein
VIIKVIADKIDEHSLKKYGYEFFTYPYFVASGFAYMMIFFGHSFYVKGMKNATDTLDGIMLVIIGALILLYIIYKNVTSTSLKFSLLVTPFQLLIFACVSFISVAGTILAVSILFQTTPVYTVNGSCECDSV